MNKTNKFLEIPILFVKSYQYCLNNKCNFNVFKDLQKVKSILKLLFKKFNTYILYLNTIINAVKRFLNGHKFNCADFRADTYLCINNFIEILKYMYVQV